MKEQNQKENRMLELLKEIPELRIKQKELIRTCTAQADTMKRFPDWTLAFNHREMEPIVDVATKGEVNNGEVSSLENDFVKKLEGVKTFGENILLLNRTSVKLSQLEKELRQTYKIVIEQ